MREDSRASWSIGASGLMWLGLCLIAGGACSTSEPDPADPNHATVAGLDSDANGVRDDVDAYIDETYSDPAVRGALRQYAKAVQIAMIDAGSAALSATHAVERFRAIECVMAQRPDDFPIVFSELRARILNTDQRTSAYLQADGQVVAATPALLPADQWSAACTTP